MSTGLELVPRELENKVVSVVHQAMAIAVTNQESYEFAARFILDYVNPVIKEIENTFGPIKKKAHEAWKEVLVQEQRHLNPMQEAKAIAASKCKVYEDEQRRLQVDRDRMAAEEARKQEEEERLNAAGAAEQAGASREEVEAILETTMPLTTVHAAPIFDRIKGVTRERQWSARMTNKLLLVRFVAANPQYLNLVDANLPALNALARAQTTLFRIPGVEAGRF